MNAQLKIEYINPKKLEAAKYNPRKWPEEALKGLRASISEFGVVDPFIVNKRNGLRLVGGHMRCKIAIELGIEKVPIVFVDLDDKKEKALNVALNNKYISGEWDESLGDLLGEIQADLPDLFDSLNMESLLADIPEIPIEVGGNQDNEKGSSTDEKWIEFKVGEVEGKLQPEVYENFLSEWERLKDITGSEKITPIMELMIASSATTPAESLE